MARSSRGPQGSTASCRKAEKMAFDMKEKIRKAAENNETTANEGN